MGSLGVTGRKINRYLCILAGILSVSGAMAGASVDLPNGDFSEGLTGWRTPANLFWWEPLRDDGRVSLHPGSSYRGDVLTQPIDVAVSGGEMINGTLVIETANAFDENPALDLVLSYQTAANAQEELLLSPISSALFPAGGPVSVTIGPVALPADARRLTAVTFRKYGYGEFILSSINLSSSAGTPGAVPEIVATTAKSGVYGSTFTLLGTDFGTDGIVELNGESSGIQIVSWSDQQIVVSVTAPAASGYLTVWRDACIESLGVVAFEVTSPTFRLDVDPYFELFKGQDLAVPFELFFDNVYTPANGIGFQCVDENGDPVVGAVFDHATTQYPGGYVMHLDTATLSAGSHSFAIEAVELAGGAAIGSTAIPRRGSFSAQIYAVDHCDIALRWYDYDTSQTITQPVTGDTLTYTKQDMMPLIFTFYGAPLNWQTMGPVGTVTSSNPTVVSAIRRGTMWEYYVFYALSNGTAVLTFTGPDGYTRTITVTVAIPEGEALFTNSLLSPQTVTNSGLDTFSFYAHSTESISWIGTVPGGMWDGSNPDNDPVWSDSNKTVVRNATVTTSADLETSYLYATSSNIGGSIRSEVGYPLTVVNAPEFAGLRIQTLARGDGFAEGIVQLYDTSLDASAPPAYELMGEMHGGIAERGAIVPGSYKARVVDWNGNGPWFGNAPDWASTETLVLSAGDMPHVDAFNPGQKVTLNCYQRQVPNLNNTLSIIATRTAPYDAELTVPCQLRALDAVEGVDFTAPPSVAATTFSTSAVFAAGASTATIDVQILENSSATTTRSFIVSLLEDFNIALDTPRMALITIDPVLPSLTIADSSVTEGDTGSTTLAFAVTLGATSADTVTVDYAVIAGTAEAGTDFDLTSGALTLAPGQTTASIDVTIYGDLLDEGDETLTVTLSNPANATLASAQATGTILDDDAPRISAAGVQVTEGSVGTTDADFVVTLDLVSALSITVDYTTASQTATSGTDFTATNGTLTFAPGETTKTITVPVLADTVDEGTETFLLQLSNPQGAQLTTSSATGTIIDDDTARLSIDDVQQLEADGGSASVTLYVNLDLVSSYAVTVDWATSDGTSRQPMDYIAASGTLTFSPGEVAKTIAVQIVGDLLDETDETINVTLSNVQNAVIDDGSAVITILDDDATSLTIADAQTTEGDTGTATLSVPVTLDLLCDRTVTVEYTATAVSATADSDYILASGTVTLVAGDAAESIPLGIIGDRVDEDDETLTITLSNPTVATIARPEATILILDNDTAALSIDNTSATEGDIDGVSQATFAVNLDPTCAFPVTCTWSTSAGTATAGTDYETASGTLTFNPGDDTKFIDISLIGDRLDETNETFTVTLADLSRGVIDHATATGTITDDDDATISVADAQVSETGGSVQVTVTLSNESIFTVTCDIALQGGTATSGADFTYSTTGVTFNPGDLTKTVTVTILDDAITEGAETLSLGVTNNLNATIGDGTGIVTILDDDSPDMAIGDAQLSEGDSGSADLVFSVTLDEPSPLIINVDYATAAGSAAAGIDYQTTSGVLTFSPGTTIQTLAVPVLGDLLDENDETFTLTLSNGVNVNLPSPTATGTIQDDDAATLAIGDAQITEGDSGSQELSFTVSLNIQSSFTVTTHWQTSDGTATAGDDYTTNSGTLTFTPGVTQQTIAVNVKGDVIDEDDETFTVTLDSPGQAAIGDGSATGTIQDDDTALLSIADAQVAENGEGVDVTITLSTPSSFSVTVTAATADSTALAGSDYTQASKSLTFAPGSTDKTMTIPILDDEVVESVEYLHVNLTNAANAGVANGTATVTITDNDAPIVSIADATATEGDPLSFAVTLDRVSPFTAIVDWALAAGTATAGSDYTDASGTLTFLAGETAKTVIVQSLDDIYDEPAETFTVTLDNLQMLNSGDLTATGTLTDNDEPWVALSLAADTISENGGTVVATLTRNTFPGVTVDLVSNDETEATAPVSIVFADNVTSATFSVDGVDDVIVDGPITVTITASAIDHAGAEISLVVIDDEHPANLIYKVTGNGKGTIAGDKATDSATGYLLVDLEQDRVVLLLKSSNGDTQEYTFHEAPALMYEMSDGRRDYWELTNSVNTNLHTVDGVDGMDYVALQGILGKRPAVIGAPDSHYLPTSLKGVRVWVDSMEEGYLSYSLLARLDKKGTTNANKADVLYETLLEDFRNELGMLDPASASQESVEPVAQLQTSGPIVIYKLTVKETEIADGASSKANFKGYLLYDLGTYEMVAITTWKEGRDLYYATDAVAGDVDTRFTATDSRGRSTTYIAQRSDLPETSVNAFELLVLEGAHSALSITADRRARIDIIKSFKGMGCSHDDVAGMYASRTIKATFSSRETVEVNKLDSTLEEAVTWLIDNRLEPRYQPQP